jgi:hypothetical protein
MTLVVIVKCVDGLVLAADSRATDIRYEAEGPEPRMELHDGIRKLFSFRPPFDNVGVLNYGFLAINEELPGLDYSTQTKRYGIAVCMEKFGQLLNKKHPRKRIKVQEFKVQLDNFLIEYWERYRKRRRAFIQKRPTFRFPVELLVAGFNDGEKEGHIFLSWLTDDDKEWEGSRYNLRYGFDDIIPSHSGIFCGGEVQFVTAALVENNTRKSISQSQRDRVEAIFAEISDMKTRFSIMAVPNANQFSLFSAEHISVYEGVRFAQLLIGGTIGYVGERGGVGGAIRVCTIKPHRGIKCLKPIREIMRRNVLCI